MQQRLALVEGADVYDLSQTLEQGMPQSLNHTPFRMALARRHGDAVRPGGGSAASEMIVTSSHVGTHLDALCHVSQDGRLHGGVDAMAAQSTGRFSEHGIETVPPFLGRGILLDVASHLGFEVLPPGYAITAADLERTALGEGVEIRAGDAVLVRTGWLAHWDDPAAYLGHQTGVPGPDEAAAQWLCSLGVRLTGSDTVAYEVIPAGAGHRVLPVHRTLLVDHGVYICETMQLDELARDRRYEFLLLLIPLKIKGATGSPVRPIAVV
jgi:kynurenine formamidase